MKKFYLVSTMALTLFSSYPSHSETLESPIGIVNVGKLFNDSLFVQAANQKLQDNVKKMEADLQTQQTLIQSLVKKFASMRGSSSAKSALKKQITQERAKLAKMTTEYQQKIKDEQNDGMREYTRIAQIATAKVAKEKKLVGVLSSAAIVYADPTWIDITEEVSRAMPTKP
jgi:Skp family chaperone for outer membrane proteins